MNVEITQPATGERHLDLASSPLAGQSEAPATHFTAATELWRDEFPVRAQTYDAATGFATRRIAADDFDAEEAGMLGDFARNS
jgi:hypothetical protein